MSEQATGTLRAVGLWGAKKSHLTVDGQKTLCGKNARGADVLLTFRHDDCTTCRQAAAKQGLACKNCGNPLLIEAKPGLCYSCSKPRIDTIT